MRLNHLHFRTPRLDETRAFYERFFGFRPHVELGATVVLANREPFYLAMDPDQADAAAEFLHFGFCLDSAERVRALHSAMRDGAVARLGELRELSPNAIQFYCEDPTGNRVEIGWYRKLPPEVVANE